VIYLVRHGETEWNKLQLWQGNSDIPLNEKGKEQAMALAKRFENHDIEAIYSSTLSRAFETAKIISKFHNIEPTAVDGLKEGVINLWNGKSMKEVLNKHMNEFEKWRKDPYAKIEGLESLGEIQMRAVRTFKDLVVKHSIDSNIIIVTHALWMKTLISWILNSPVTENRRFKIDNASVSKVIFDGENFYLASLNETWHIDYFDKIFKLNLGGVKDVKD